MQISLARRPSQTVAVRAPATVDVRTSRAPAKHTPTPPVRRWSRGQVAAVAVFAAFIATPTAVAILSTYQL